MNIKTFTRNLESIQRSLYSSEFLSETRRSSFSDDKLAMLLTEIAKVAVQTALSLEELEQKERTLALTEEKTRQEIELMLLNAKFQNRIQLIEALKGLIQAHAMAKASGDNANINKANAYNAFLNIVGNAENTDMIAKHSSNVLETINAIDSAPLSAYDSLMHTLKNEASQLLNYQAKEVLIYTPKLELEVGETIKLMGFSVYGENQSEFIINEIVTSGNTTYFTAGESGEYEVFYRVKNNAGTFISDSIKLQVTQTEFEKLNTMELYDSF